ncbi:MAG: PleD family two-component system response regulator [Spirochaetota bacterium]|jgi:DNA-binding response OmpR family regulator
MYLILAIDDDRNALKLLETQIKKMGHSVVVAASGREGIELARTGNPDLILLDIMMPYMDGFEVVKQMKKDEITRSIPIIMLTSKSKKEDVVTAMRQGAADYIIKPHTYAMLTQKIDAALRIGHIQKLEEAAERTEHINLSRGTGTTLISFKTGIKDREVLAEARKIFNAVFLKLARNDNIVFDLRSLGDVDAEDASVLSVIAGLFSEKEVNIVAGRHYGTLVSLVDFEERIRLHISFGDLEVYLNSKRR